MDLNIGDRTSPLHGSITGQVGEKRKASTSPGSEVSCADSIIVRRPTKARVIESNEPRNSDDDNRKIRDSGSISSNLSKEVRDSPITISSPEEKRITRGATNKAKYTADFSKLKESRKIKENTSYKTEGSRYKERSQSLDKKESPRSGSSDRIIRQTDDLIRRINIANEESSSEDSFRWKSPQQVDRSNASRKKRRDLCLSEGIYRN